MLEERNSENFMFVYTSKFIGIVVLTTSIWLCVDSKLVPSERKWDDHLCDEDTMSITYHFSDVQR